MNKVINYLREWNVWRKRNLNGKTHHFLVLIEFVHSPTFDAFRNSHF